MRIVISVLFYKLAKLLKNLKFYKFSLILNDLSMYLKKEYNNLNLKGLIFLKQNDIKKSLDMFKKSVKIQENFEAYLGIAEVYHQRNEYNDAIANCKNALNLNVKDEERKYAMFLLALLYYKKKKYYEAKEIFIILKQNEKFKLQANVILIKIYLKEKQIQEAKVIIDELMESPKTKDIGKYLLAYYLYVSDKIDRAKEIIKQIDIDYDPDNLLEKIYDPRKK